MLCIAPSGRMAPCSLHRSPRLPQSKTLPTSVRSYHRILFRNRHFAHAAIQLYITNRQRRMLPDPSPHFRPPQIKRGRKHGGIKLRQRAICQLWGKAFMAAFLYYKVCARGDTYLIINKKGYSGTRKRVQYHRNHFDDIYSCAVVLPTCASGKAGPAFSGRPNDWLSPTGLLLNTHGIGYMRGLGAFHRSFLTPFPF